WIIWLAVKQGHRSFDGLAHDSVFFRQLGQAALDDLVLALAFGDLGGISVGSPGGVVDRGQDALIFQERRRGCFEAALQLLQSAAEDQGIAAGADRKAVIKVADMEGAGPIVELNLLGLERLAVRISQNGEENAFLELAARRSVPGDVEEEGVRR